MVHAEGVVGNPAAFPPAARNLALPLTSGCGILMDTRQPSVAVGEAETDFQNQRCNSYGLWLGLVRSLSEAALANTQRD
jgi:hypothetical protein